MKYCKVWPNVSIPTAWILEGGQTNEQAVINHNPLPDITHEDFISILGPVLAPENYPAYSPGSQSTSPRAHATPSGSNIGQQTPSRPSTVSSATVVGSSLNPAPFDWFHFEGRSVKTTLNNISGVEGLARERKWRSHCIFSIDVGRKARQGVEVLIPHADVIFFSKAYALTVSPHYATSPRSFLLSMSGNAPPHALLIANWGNDGNALLSLPTREYFQSSKWEAPPSNPANRSTRNHPGMADNRLSATPTISEYSVISGSEYYVGGRGTPSSSNFTARSASSYSEAHTDPRFSGHQTEEDYRSAHIEPGPAAPLPAPTATSESVLDEVATQDAFVAGMIYSLSRRLLPDPIGVYTPGGEARNSRSESDRTLRWKLDECLRFATELSGRKAQKTGWDGLGAEMATAGWFSAN